jgi:phosphatidylglycerol---prolipoprotein diacylglyceryl transferase
MFINTLDPVFLHIGFLTIHWYGLFLVLGIFFVVFFWEKLFKKEKYNKDLVYELAIWFIIGGTIGARLGEVFFYEPVYYLSDPIKILFIQQGGLSSHGMAIGLTISFLLFIRKKKLNWKKLLDTLVIPLPILFAFIRLGNFFNSEIIGRQTDMPWGVMFPRVEVNPVLRHPSQIYEMLLSILIFFILFFIYKKKYIKIGKLKIFALFVVLYFSTRFFVEFVKEYQTLESTGIFTMGQWLSVPFILVGIGMFVFGRKIVKK